MDDSEAKYISGKQAQLILNITTRQGLHKIVKEHNITIKSQGAGKPNLYLESDVISVNEKTITQRKRTNPRTIEKAETIKNEIKTRKRKADKLKAETKKEIEEIVPPKEKLPATPQSLKMEDLLNEVGQDEFSRVVQLLQDRGTYRDEDRALILTYAVSYQNWVFATIASGKEDNTTMDQFGNLKLHPYMVVSDKCLTQMTKIASILGIGARSRLGIDIKQPKKDSIFDVLNAKDEDF